ncbi:MAG: cation-translocating P-type ATPase [Anaerolineales bacterium]|nr:cation-translocating P-type ATPase [Anaerolineales bacterium]
MNWHTVEAQAALRELDSSAESGLSAAQARVNAQKYGANEISAPRSQTLSQTLKTRFASPLTLLMLAAAFAATFSSRPLVAYLALVLVVAYLALDFVQNRRADSAVLELQKMTAQKARVIRDGATQEIPARELTLGDIVRLESGDLVPADLRLMEAVNLQIQESALDDQSDPTGKHAAALSNESLPLNERRNMTYLGGRVAQGRGLGVVVAVGMASELGKIAVALQNARPRLSPLRRRFDSFSAALTLFAALGLIFALFFKTNFDTIVSLLLAAAPVSLPVVAAVSFARGAKRLLKRRVVVRRASALETLGAIDAICVEKTGVLTENRMIVAALETADYALDFGDGAPRSPLGLDAAAQSSLSLTAIGGALCNDAKFVDEGDNRLHAIGNSIEGALIVAAAKMGYWKSSLDISFPRAAELAYDSERKRMTVVHHLGQYAPTMLSGLELGEKRYIAFCKGGADELLAASNQVWEQGKAEPLDAARKSRIEAANERLVQQGMRVVAVGFRLLNALPEILQTDLEQNFTFVGMFGMSDPPRPEIRAAIESARAEGIRPLLFSDDAPEAALKFAREINLDESGRALSGAEVARLNDDELQNLVGDVSVFLRAAPEQQARITQALQARGQIVALVGEDVNDAPALRFADVGVALGIAGASAAKEAADLILLDDQFTTLLASVREGRGIFASLFNGAQLMAAGAMGRILAILFAPIFGLASPLPLQVFWLTLLADGLLGMALGAEDSSPSSTLRKKRFWNPRLFLIGLFGGAFALLLAARTREAQTTIFASLAFMQIFYALSMYSEQNVNADERRPRAFFIILFSVVLLLALTLYLPAWANFFGLARLSSSAFTLAAFSGLALFILLELQKQIRVSR